MIYTPSAGAEAVAVMEALRREPVLDVDFTIEHIDIDGGLIEDITTSVVKSGGMDSSIQTPSVTHTSTDTTPGVLTFGSTRTMAWGADIVRPSQLITCHFRPIVNPLGTDLAVGDVVRFPLGAYIVTSPENDMQADVTYDVTAYDKIYLLKADIGDTFPANSGTTYNNRVMQLMKLAGIPDVDDGTLHLNPAVVRFPSAWGTKTIPVDKDQVWPSDDSNNFQYIDVINELLKASGCRPLYTDRDGVFAIEETPKPETQSPLWTFSRTATSWDPDFERREVVLSDGSVHANDLWGVPNRFLFIQSGLTFDPVASDGSDGKYVIDNAPSDSKHYRPGSDQSAETGIGRIIRSVQHLSASGQTDLITQAEAIFTDLFADAETIQIATAPWPCAGHYDVFRYADANLPRVDSRKVQAQSWELPLDGIGNMTWNTSVVGDL